MASMLAQGRLDAIGLQSKMSVAWAREVSVARHQNL